MYGGKFIPFHKGHALCLSVALALCEEVHLILFINGDDEIEIMKNDTTYPKELLSPESRIKYIKDIVKDNSRVKFHVIDVMSCKKEDGTEDWDKETPLVLNECWFDAVFSSEPSYSAYFTRAYPHAPHILVDPKREKVPISATMIRNMTEEEAIKWIA